MNSVHLHLILNHVPVIGTIFALLLLAFGLWKRSDDITKAALGAFAVSALVSIPVYISGENAAEVVNKLPGMTGDAIEAHDRAAQISFTLILVLGVVSGIGLWRARKRSVSRRYALLVFFLALIGSITLGWTANLGGKIRHTEIQRHTESARD